MKSNQKKSEDDYFTKVYQQLAKQFGIPTAEVRQICRSEFRYIWEIMHSQSTKNILINELFKFKLKKRYETNKTKYKDPRPNVNRWDTVNRYDGE